MNCDQVRTLLNPYVDDELDLSSSLEIESHLQECAGCGSEYQSLRVLHHALASGALYSPAPAAMRKRVRASVREENRLATGGRALPWSLLGAAAGLALLALIAWGLIQGLNHVPQDNVVAQEALSSSMRSLVAGPLTEVQSSDRHTVKPWFAGKLDFSPTVQDFAAQGFPLAGGRVDYMANRPVAVLVYRHQQHVVNLYTWPSADKANGPLQTQTLQGYNVFSWTQNGMVYWVVSDMDAGELRQFVQLVQHGIL